MSDFVRGLRLIASGGCENFDSRHSDLWCGSIIDGEPAREGGPYGKYGYNSWCHPCIAKAALTGTLPRPIICIEVGAV